MAKFFVKGTTAQVAAVKDNAAYAKSIIFDTEKGVIWQGGKMYGADSAEFASALENLKYFTTISGDTGSAAAPSAGSTLKILGGTGIDTAVGVNGVTVTHENVASNIATTGDYVSGITVNAQGHVTAVTKGSLPTNHVVNTRKVSAGEGLEGGGALNADLTISHAAAGVEDTTKAINAAANKYVSGIKLDKFGHAVGVAETALPTAPTLADLGGVPNTRKVNGKPLSADVTLGVADISGAVPNTRKVNNKALSADIELTGADIKATGYAKGADAEIAATDTLNVALGKALGLIDALKTKTDGLTGAMHFKGVMDAKPAVTDYVAGDVIIVNGVEYVLTVDGSTKSWEEFGDQSLHGQLATRVTALEAKPGLDKIGTVTSVAMTVPVGFAVTGSPVTSTGTLALGFADGYSLPTNDRQDDWDAKVSFPGFGSVAPSANGTAAAGTSTQAARADHVHPLLTTVSGNAGTATKLLNPRSFQISGDGTAAAVNFDGSANVNLVFSLDWEEL